MGINLRLFVHSKKRIPGIIHGSLGLGYQNQLKLNIEVTSSQKTIKSSKNMLEKTIRCLCYGSSKFTIPRAGLANKTK